MHFVEAQANQRLTLLCWTTDGAVYLGYFDSWSIRHRTIPPSPDRPDDDQQRH